MDQRLAELATVTVQRNKAQGYQTLLEENLNKKENVIKIVKNVVTQDHVGLVIGRQIISDLVKAVETKQISDDGTRRDIIQQTLEILQPKVVSFDEQVSYSSAQMMQFLKNYVAGDGIEAPNGRLSRGRRGLVRRRSRFDGHPA